MARTSCSGLSQGQKVERWRRWKAGEALGDICRALRKHAASGFGVVATNGGFAPVPRSRKPGLRCLDGREEISRGLVEGRSFQQLGRNLGRAVSPIRREVAGNAGRRAYRRPKPRQMAINPALCKRGAGKLSDQWSQQQISGSLKASFPGDPPLKPSHETIYKSLFIRARDALKKEMLPHLGRREDKSSTLCRSATNPPEMEDCAIPGH